MHEDILYIPLLRRVKSYHISSRLVERYLKIQIDKHDKIFTFINWPLWCSNRRLDYLKLVKVIQTKAALIEVRLNISIDDKSFWSPDELHSHMERSALK